MISRIQGTANNRPNFGRFTPRLNKAAGRYIDAETLATLEKTTADWDYHIDLAKGSNRQRFSLRILDAKKNHVGDAGTHDTDNLRAGLSDAIDVASGFVFAPNRA